MADEKRSLPENAYRELKPGESYTAVITDERGVLEITVRSVAVGIAMGILFSAAAAYIALKLGYSETAAFDHAFKKATGCSPSQYRRRTKTPLPV